MKKKKYDDEKRSAESEKEKEKNSMNMKNVDSQVKIGNKSL